MALKISREFNITRKKHPVWHLDLNNARKACPWVVRVALTL